MTVHVASLLPRLTPSDYQQVSNHLKDIRYA
jgi:hypothetical protein